MSQKFARPAGMVAVVHVPTAGGAIPAVEILGQPSVARQLAAGASSASTALTATCHRVSLRAVGADIRFAVGVGAQTASATSHYIGDGERLDIAVPAGAHIAVIRDATTDGVLHVSELA